MTLRQPTFGHGGNARFDEEVEMLKSKAIASLDAWLDRAERVLQELRDEATSSPDVFGVCAPNPVPGEPTVMKQGARPMCRQLTLFEGTSA